MRVQAGDPVPGRKLSDQSAGGAGSCDVTGVVGGKWQPAELAAAQSDQPGPPPVVELTQQLAGHAAARHHPPSAGRAEPAQQPAGGPIRRGADVWRAVTAGAGWQVRQTQRHTVLGREHPRQPGLLPRLRPELCQPAMQRYIIPTMRIHRHACSC